MRLGWIQVRQHLETYIETDMNLTAAPSHVVSAGGVSFTVPAGSPQEEASDWKYMWMTYISFIKVKLPIIPSPRLPIIPSPAAQACKVTEGTGPMQPKESVPHKHRSTDAMLYTYQTHTVKPVFIADNTESSTELIEEVHVSVPHVALEVLFS